MFKFKEHKFSHIQNRNNRLRSNLNSRIEKLKAINEQLRGISKRLKFSLEKIVKDIME